jgi:hypothetical protein
MALDRTWYNTLVDDDGSGITGSVWDKADVDALMDAVDAEIARIDTGPLAIGASVSMSANVPIGAGVEVPLNIWNVVDWQNPAGIVAVNQNLICPAGGQGIYLVTANLMWLADPTGIRYLYLYKNSPAAVKVGWHIVPGHSTALATHSFAFYVRLAAGEYVNLHGLQTSGANLATAADGARFQMVRVGRY